MSYTLKEAAAAVGKQKPAILKAIQSGRISAQKDELGVWRIEPAELHRVYPPVSKEVLPGTTSTEAQEAVGNSNGNSLLRQEVEFLREKLADLNRMTDQERQQLFERIEDLRNERDRLLKVVEEQAGTVRQLTDQRQQAEPAVTRKGLRGWLHRITA